jgi:catechol 2,3-dioxygenase-like lactoylglutathione lyase family enzyme
MKAMKTRLTVASSMLEGIAIGALAVQGLNAQAKPPAYVIAEGPMKRTWTIIGVADVPQSFKWYQSLLGLPEAAPAHDYFGQILDSDGTVLLCLHKWGAHEHPSLTSPSYAKPGNGLLLFFRVDNFDVALPRARTLVSRLEEEPHVNPNTGTAEFSLRDPDGYYVTISALNAA